MRGWRKILLAAGFAAICSGCVDEQKEVARYRGILESDDTPQLPATLQEEPLTLQRALRLANQHNEQLALSGEGYLQALIDKDRAFSGFLPTITLGPSFSMIDRPKVDKPSLADTTLKAVRSAAINSVAKSIAGGLPATPAGTLAGGVVTAAGSALAGGGSGSSASSVSSVSSGGIGQSYRVNGGVLERTWGA